jgi:hypothetical protein
VYWMGVVVWLGGEGVLKVRVEAILVLVLLAKVKVGDGHVGGGSSHSGLCCCSSRNGFSDVRSSWGSREQLEDRGRAAVIKPFWKCRVPAPRLGHTFGSQDRTGTVVPSSPSVHAMGSLLEVPGCQFRAEREG